MLQAVVIYLQIHHSLAMTIAITPVGATTVDTAAMRVEIVALMEEATK